MYWLEDWTGSESPSTKDIDDGARDTNKETGWSAGGAQFKWQHERKLEDTANRKEVYPQYNSIN
jgi:hypothetical protein